MRNALMAELERTDITARVRQARKEAGLTQEAMAELLDVRPRTYQNYEGTRVPWGLMSKIADVTGRNTKWLLHGDEPAAEPAPTGDLIGALDAGRSQMDRIEQKLDAIQTRLDALDADAIERDELAAALLAALRDANSAGTGPVRRRRAS